MELLPSHDFMEEQVDMFIIAVGELRLEMLDKMYRRVRSMQPHRMTETEIADLVWDGSLKTWSWNEGWD